MYKCGTNASCNEGLCSCTKGFEGNPYKPKGCQDIDECSRPVERGQMSIDGSICHHICTNRPSYTCSCRDGWVFDVDHTFCNKIDDFLKVKKPAIIVIATCAGLGAMLATAWWLHKVLRRRKIRKLEQKFFKRSGGLLLHQQVSSSEGNAETTKLFTSKELEKTTDQYNVYRIVGQGGLGTVYKGMLTDGRIVAVKKSKIEDESKLEHFNNEVVNLSQINHMNIVKLHGCCLQIEVPLLVYEFIPNGTLMQYIHEQNEYFPLTWDVRVRVATEIQSSLLFTFGYLDPEYYRSGQFTDKSDVYSFGVVLVVLLTGQKPILPPTPDNEARNLANLFLLALEENRILDILDSRITKEGNKEEMITFANIAYRCLNFEGRRRPTMKQVVAELESIINTNGSPSAQQHYEDDEIGISELIEPWESDVTSTSMSSTIYHSLTVDIEPLMTN